MIILIGNNAPVEMVSDPRLKHQESAPLDASQTKVDTSNYPKPSTKTPQPVNTSSPNMAPGAPMQLPPGMHPGMHGNMMQMPQNPNQNMQMPFMGQMVMMMPQMGMRPPFMMHAPMPQQNFQNMQNMPNMSSPQKSSEKQPVGGSPQNAPFNAQPGTGHK